MARNVLRFLLMFEINFHTTVRTTADAVTWGMKPPEPFDESTAKCPQWNSETAPFFFVRNKDPRSGQKSYHPKLEAIFVWSVDVVMEKNPLVMMLVVVWKSSNKEQCDVFFGEQCFDVHFPLYMIMQMVVIVAQEMIQIH